MHEIGAQITRDYKDITRPLLLIGVLKGAVVMLADLLRTIQRPVECDFVAIASYGKATESSGEIKILKDLDASIAGKDVLIVEDILDTGLTLHCLMELLRARHPHSLNVCVLLNKPARRALPVPITYCGFEIEDVFVVGYGLDYAEQYRQLPDIAEVVHENEL